MSSPEGSLPDFSQFHSLELGTRIAEGGDSVVYRFGGYVVKEYKNSIYIDQVTQYQKATEQVVASLIEDPLTQEVKIGDETWDGRYYANPIIEVLSPQHSIGLVKAVSRYIAGPNGNDLMLGTNVYTGRLHQQLDELGDTAEATFLREIGRKMPERKLRDNFLRSTLSNALMERIRIVTGVRNLRTLSALNIKYRANTENQTLNMIVTDFADDLEDLVFP